ncbi:MAG: redox-sensing transcriptional repressor Rex [Chloroflexi bacterium]|nr:redox-sensing transcriptional repressor Rex [Chloroflexota bacterium]MCL5108887.1 redox-sensing transcriptional repressor Rex [Chloroflexota bacterium]
MAASVVPDETVGRLVTYVDYLERLLDQEVATVSSRELAAAAGVNAAQVRKDFSYLVPYRLGYFGTPGVGYEVRRLLYQLTRFLGVTHERRVVLVGYGSLGAALARYRGFAARNFNMVAVFDVDPAKIGKKVDGALVHGIDRLGEVLAQTGAEIAILATPASSAQSVAEKLAQAGIRAILNFAPVVLSLPRGVTVRQVDLSREMQLLAFRAMQDGESARAHHDSLPEEERQREP